MSAPLTGPGPGALAGRPDAQATSQRNLQRLAGVVIATARGGVLVEAGGERWLMSARGAWTLPELGRGAPVQLERAGTGATGAARLLTVAGRAVEPPLPVRLQAAAASPEQNPKSSVLEVSARVLAPGGARGLIRLQILPAASVSPGADGRRDALATPAAAGAAQSFEMIGQDPQGRALLRGQGMTLRLELPLDLPRGSMLRALALPAPALPPPSSAPAGQAKGPLEILARMLLGPDEASPAQSAPPPAVATRLLRLIEALAGRHGPAASEERAPAGPRTAGAAPPSEGPPARDVLPGGWRLALLPLGAPSDGQMLRLYHQTERDGRSATGRPEEPRRAVFEVDFDRLGRCQLDAWCRGTELKLLLRTARPLPPGLREEIGVAFAAACEVTGLRGALGFAPGALLRLPEAPAALAALTA